LHYFHQHTQVISKDTESASNKISNWISCNFVITPEGENPCLQLSTQTQAQWQHKARYEKLAWPKVSQWNDYRQASALTTPKMMLLA
jgi:hypothetical protein